MAHADYEKVGPDKRTPAQLAEAECSSRANSARPVVSTLPAESIGMAIRRNFYIKDCMASRGFKKPPKKRKKIEYNR